MVFGVVDSAYFRWFLDGCYGVCFGWFLVGYYGVYFRRVSRWLLGCF